MTDLLEPAALPTLAARIERAQAAQNAAHGLMASWLVAAPSRLEFAARHGCTVASSSTGPGTTSQRNLERQGFRIAYPKAVLVRDRT